MLAGPLKSASFVHPGVNLLSLMRKTGDQQGVLSIGLPLQQTRQLVSHDARISGYHGSVRERLPCADVNSRFCDTYVNDLAQ